MTIRALVLDDEAIIAADTAQLVAARDGWAAEAVTHCSDAAARLAQHPYDVVFLDIEMPGMTGIEFAKEIEALRPEAHIVFVTAYPDYAVKAFRLDATDYLVKPLARSVLAEACSRIESRLAERRGADGAPERKIAVKSFGRTDMVPVSLIDYVRAERNYVALVCGEREHLHRATISDMEQELLPEGFVRCHRSYLVRPGQVSSLKRRHGVVSELTLAAGALVPVGAAYRKSIQAAVAQQAS